MEIAACDADLPGDRPPIPTPILAAGALDDAICPLSQMTSWRDFTSTFLGYRCFRGGHMYISNAFGTLLPEARAILLRQAT